MIGKVIEGRYAGARVNKIPEKNVLYVQTEDGSKIALSKTNGCGSEIPVMDTAAMQKNTAGRWRR